MTKEKNTKSVGKNTKKSVATNLIIERKIQKNTNIIFSTNFQIIRYEFLSSELEICVSVRIPGKI